MNRRALASVLAVSTLGLALSACATDTDRSTTESGVQVIEEGKLTVCTHLPYEPFQYKEGGEVVGFDVDLMDLVAEDLDLEQEIVNTPFETIETGQAMSTGKCDIAAAGMTITEERDQVMDFSDPYFDATQALLVKKGAGYDSLEALAGKTLGVQAGTTGEDYAEENAPEDVELKVFEDLALLLEAVKTGSIDAGDQRQHRALRLRRAEPRHRGDHRVRHRRAVRLRRRQGRQRRAARRRQRGLPKAQEDGTYEKIFEQYFPDLEEAHHPRLTGARTERRHGA